MNQVEPLGPDQFLQSPHRSGRGARALRHVGGDEREPPLRHEPGERTGGGEDRHVVTPIPYRCSEFDGVDLASADLELVRIDE